LFGGSPKLSDVYPDLCDAYHGLYGDDTGSLKEVKEE